MKGFTGHAAAKQLFDIVPILGSLNVFSLVMSGSQNP